VSAPRRLLVLVAVAAGAALAPGTQAPAHAGTECNGLLVCIPVAGPWVKIPPQTGNRRAPTYYQQSCPSGSVIGGIDAEVTHRSIDISFAGALGGPVSPGVTTRRAAVFAAVETGRLPLPTAFRPLLGCVPVSGGGGRGRTFRPPTRALTALGAEPGQPTLIRVRSFRVPVGRSRVASHGCRQDERLISATHAIAFHQRRAPTARQLSQVEAQASITGRRIRVTASGGAILGGLRVRVQMLALCARPNP
jgi:hypothetical protein